MTKYVCMYGYVYEQHLPNLGLINPHVVLENPMHPLRVIVWFGLLSEVITGQYFFENKDDVTTTVNGDTYRTIITYFFV